MVLSEHLFAWADISTDAKNKNSIALYIIFHIVSRGFLTSLFYEDPLYWLAPFFPNFDLPLLYAVISIYLMVLLNNLFLIMNLDLSNLSTLVPKKQFLCGKSRVVFQVHWRLHTDDMGFACVWFGITLN